MEFDFDINHLFPEEISHFEASTLRFALKKDPELSDKMKTVVDRIGRGSSVAQGLPQPVTLLYKFLISDSDLFVLKDAEANGGAGAVLGYLKVGTKDLFLHDSRERLVKTRPVCVLDFYVHESRQRRGYGRRLFDYMLSQSVEGKLKPCHVAFDRPSDKLVPFLKKHYDLNHYIPQYNQFFVAPGFFVDNPCQSRVGGSGTSTFFPYTKHLPRRPGIDYDAESVAAVTAPVEFVSESRPVTALPSSGFSGNSSSNALTIDALKDTLPSPRLGEQPLRFSRHEISTASGRRSPVSRDAPSPVLKALMSLSDRNNNDNSDDNARPDVIECPENPDPHPESVESGGSETEKRDWTHVPRNPIGSSISKPVGSKTPNNFSAANSLIWLPSSASSSYRVRAPYATVSPKAELLAYQSELTAKLGSLPPKRPLDNKRFQRTSLW